MNLMDLQNLKKRLRDGAYAWPGGYPLFFVLSDGAALCFKCAKKEWREIVTEHLNPTQSGWGVVSCEVNWEDESCHCDHCWEKIEAAYR